ncbi:MAG: PTS transporter subunit EIIC, partial [Oscillospiraceae bacterium]
MKDKIFAVLQRIGRSFMLPIAILPIAGLLLGIGSSFTNPTTLEAYGLTRVIHEGGLLYTILDIMSETGNIVFANLPLLFAMGVAIGMAKKEKSTAALSAAVAYLIMNTAISVMITAYGGVEAMQENSTASVLGITTLQMGVFGGIIVGLGTAALHNRFYKIELPQVVSFFGGTRFVPIICSLVYLIVGIVMFYIWGFVQTGISNLGNLVLESGYAGTWIYGIIERALIPFGLHHVFYMPFWQTSVGGTAVIDGVTVSGAQNIFFAELASKSTEVFSVSATRFMSGKFPFMIFGLPAAAYAMYRTARPEKKKAVGGLLLSAALTSMITGITEPLEFTFLFVAPAMYAVHCVLAGLSYMLMHIFNVGVGMTFSGGLIDLTLFGILQGNAKTNWIWIVIVGLFYAVIYYFVFYFMITKLNLKTPGREAEGEETKLYTRKDLNARNETLKGSSLTSAIILKGLGGKANISDIDCCATRLRVTVDDPAAADEALLKQSGASGVIRKGNGIQVVYGPRVSVIKSDLEDFMDSPDSDNIDKLLENVLSSPEAEKELHKSSGGSAKTISLAAHMNGTAIPL